METRPREIEVAPHGDRASLTVRGELDIERSEQLRREATYWLDRVRHLTVDLSQVSFMDSQGMKVLLDLSNHARAHRRDLSLRAPEKLGGRRVIDVLGVPGLPWV